MTRPDLEESLHSYYRTLTPRDSSHVMAASRATLEDARRPNVRRMPSLAVRGFLSVAATMAAAVALLAVLVLPRLGFAPGPATGPTFDPAPGKATADTAGLMGSGGIWAMSGSYILTSTDNGASWRAMSRPLGPNYEFLPPFVLDPEHVWIAGRASAVPGDKPAWNVPLARSSDGGRTWLETTVSLPYDCEGLTLSFVDASHGFMMCTADGSATALRTVDGGASWQITTHSTSLGRSFTASDANTLWSARDAGDLGSPVTSVVELNVSRDGGLSWTPVNLPDLKSIAEANSRYAPKDVIAGGPTFFDAAHGAFAVFQQVDPNAAAIWIYRTTDGGRTWTLEKKSGPWQWAVLGRNRAILPATGTSRLTTSSDSGATWTEVPGFGLPAAGTYAWLYNWIGITDGDNAAALINYNPALLLAQGGPLMLSSDGGRTWRPADFGDSRAKVPADAVLDPDAAGNAANFYEEMVRRPLTTDLQQGAWRLLSPYSEQAFGTYAAFVAAEPSILPKSPKYGNPQRGSDVLSAQNLGTDLWRDLEAHADMSRAYVVEVEFPDTSVGPDTLVAAPLSSTGEWRIWVATK